MDLFWIVLFHMRRLLCSRQTEQQGQRPLVSIHVWKHFNNSAFHGSKMESWGHIQCCLWMKWTKGTLKPSFNLASTTDGATFRFQVLKDSLIAWELVWLSVPNFYASGKILAQDRAKLYRRGGGGKKGGWNVYWGNFCRARICFCVLFCFFQYLSSSDRELTVLIRPGRTSHWEGWMPARSIWEQDTDAPIAPVVWVLVVLLRQRMAVFPQTPINPRGSFIWNFVELVMLQHLGRKEHGVLLCVCL